MHKFALLIALTSTVCLASADTLKASVTDMNKKVNAALKQKDMKAFVAATKGSTTKDFKYIENGKTMNFDTMVATMKTSFASLKAVSSVTSTIKKIEEKGSKGTVWTEHMTIATMVGPDKKTHKMTMAGSSTSECVKEGKSWKVATMTWTNTAMTMDGKPFDMSKMGG